MRVLDYQYDPDRLLHPIRRKAVGLIRQNEVRENHLREAHRLFTEMGPTGHGERVAKELT